MKRTTLVACFDDDSNKKIRNSIKSLGEFCKVPYNINDRFNNDTLPYHITLSAWDNDKTDYIVSMLKAKTFKKIQSNFVFNVMDSSIKGNILYLESLNDFAIKTLQKMAFDLLPTEKYDPLIYKLHSTINIDENKSINLQLLNKLKNKKISLTIDKICLYEIYPAKLLFILDFFDNKN